MMTSVRRNKKVWFEGESIGMQTGIALMSEGEEKAEWSMEKNRGVES